MLLLHFSDLSTCLIIVLTLPSNLTNEVT